MTDADLEALEVIYFTPTLGTHWDTCHIDGSPRHHAECAVYRLLVEVRRLRGELAEQQAMAKRLADRLAACSHVLGRAAERGKVCGCQVNKEDDACD